MAIKCAACHTEMVDVCKKGDWACPQCDKGWVARCEVERACSSDVRPPNKGTCKNCRWCFLLPDEGATVCLYDPPRTNLHGDSEESAVGNRPLTAPNLTCSKWEKA